MTPEHQAATGERLDHIIEKLFHHHQRNDQAGLANEFRIQLGYLEDIADRLKNARPADD